MHACLPGLQDHLNKQNFQQCAFFSLYLPFVFFISVAVRMLVWLIYSGDLATLINACNALFVLQWWLGEGEKRCTSLIKKFIQVKLRLITVL